MHLLGKIWKYNTPYISEAGAKKLPYYKYSITDDSLFYKYFWSPVAEFLTKYTPNWIAYFIIS